MSKKAKKVSEVSEANANKANAVVESVEANDDTLFVEDYHDFCSQTLESVLAQRAKEIEVDSRNSRRLRSTFKLITERLQKLSLLRQQEVFSKSHSVYAIMQDAFTGKLESKDAFTAVEKILDSCEKSEKTILRHLLYEHAAAYSVISVDFLLSFVSTAFDMSTVSTEVSDQCSRTYHSTSQRLNKKSIEVDGKKVRILTFATE